MWRDVVAAICSDVKAFAELADDVAHVVAGVLEVPVLAAAAGHAVFGSPCFRRSFSRLAMPRRPLLLVERLGVKTKNRATPRFLKELAGAHRVYLGLAERTASHRLVVR
jgi:hypothetical protein